MINNEVYNKFFELCKDENIIKAMYKRPWAMTIRKFDEVFKDTGFKIGRRINSKGNYSNYQLLYNEEVVFNLKTVNDFFNNIFKYKNNLW